MFYDPQFVDFDLDGDHDLFIRKDGVYRFYERLNTAEDFSSLHDAVRDIVQSLIVQNDQHDDITLLTIARTC